jgi:hypothetical protein
VSDLKRFVAGQCVEAGTDDDGNVRLVIHTTREELAGLAQNIVHQPVRVELAETQSVTGGAK